MIEFILDIYKNVKNFIGLFFTWSLILILLTGGEITIQIGLIDWLVKLLNK